MTYLCYKLLRAHIVMIASTSTSRTMLLQMLSDFVVGKDKWFHELRNRALANFSTRGYKRAKSTTGRYRYEKPTKGRFRYKNSKFSHFLGGRNGLLSVKARALRKTRVLRYDSARITLSKFLVVSSKLHMLNDLSRPHSLVRHATTAHVTFFCCLLVTRVI